MTREELNRALLARQLLLERADMPPASAIEHLAGLQAQVVNPPYIGLWTRLRGFEHAQLSELITTGKVVRATAMRGTLHLLTDDDYDRLRAALQPAVERALRGFHGKRIRDMPLERVVATARELLAARPRTSTELRNLLAEREPDFDPHALSFVARTLVPVVQVPPAGTWGRAGTVAYTVREHAPDPDGHGRTELVRRYLGAFGPATVKDAQAWAGMTGLKAVVSEFEEVAPGLFDLPGAPRPEPEAPARPRLVPDYDNLVLGHADRSRIVPEEHRRHVFPGGGVVRATILVDGFVAGVWKLSKAGAITIEPFARLRARDRDALGAEAEDLLRFAGNPGGPVSFAD